MLLLETGDGCGSCSFCGLCSFCSKCWEGCGRWSAGASTLRCVWTIGKWAVARWWLKDITETFYFPQSSRALQARVKMKECREGGEEIMDSWREKERERCFYYSLLYFWPRPHSPNCTKVTVCKWANHFGYWGLGMRVPREEEVLAFLIGREGTRTNSLFSLNIIYHVRPYSHLGPEDRGTGGTRGDWIAKGPLGNVGAWVLGAWLVSERI